MNTQIECVKMSYNISTMRASIKQINIIIKKITLKISASWIIKQNINSESIIVNFKFKKETESEQTINLSHSCKKYQRYSQNQKYKFEDNLIRQHL